MATEWCTIESDPGVFSELIEELGTKDLSVEEIISMEDPVHMSSLAPIHGFIFLFRWDNQTPYKTDRLCFSQDELFFAKQVITNNCATQALLSILLNSEQDIELGENLKQFKEFSMMLDPLSRGEAIGQSEHIKKVHNSFAKPDGFLYVRDPKDKRKGQQKDAFHFVSYIRHKESGRVYELDGLREGPILLGTASEGTSWTEIVTKEVQERMNHYISNEIRFALLAIVNSPSLKINKELEELTSEIKSGLTQLKTLENVDELVKDLNFDINSFLLDSEEPQMTETKIEEENSMEPAKLVNHLNTLNIMYVNAKDKLSHQVKKKENRTTENARRKHNYIPFIFELLKLGVNNGILEDFYNEAKQK